MRSCDRLTWKLLNASPSDRRISRRITLSCVLVLPLISTRSTYDRFASAMLKLSVIVSVSLSRWNSGFTSVNA